VNVTDEVLPVAEKFILQHILLLYFSITTIDQKIELTEFQFN